MHHDLIDNYADRIARALTLIEDTQEGEDTPGLAALASAAAFSPFHFHRVFRLMTGETVGAAVRRIRLARSLADLTDGTRSVTTAAAGSGYATSQAFARAMQAVTGATASAFRSNPALARRISARLRQAPSLESPLGIEVTSLDPFRVVALRREGPYESLDEGYDALFEQVFSQVGMDRLRGIWGVPLDDPFSVLPEARSFDCALDVGEVKADMAGVEIVVLGGGQVLAANHIGSYDDIHAAFDGLYAHALAHGLALADAPPLIQYHDQPDEKPESQLRATLFLPIAEAAPAGQR